MRVLRVFVFEAFLKSSMQLQTTRSPRLLNGFRSFLVQKKVESLLVLFLLFPVHFCWAESTKNFQWSKRLCFFSCPNSKGGGKLISWCWGKYLKNQRYIARNQDCSKRISKSTGKVVTNQISAQSEHFCNMHAQKNKKPRNQIAYRRAWGRRRPRKELLLGCPRESTSTQPGHPYQQVSHPTDPFLA